MKFAPSLLFSLMLIAALSSLSCAERADTLEPGDVEQIDVTGGVNLEDVALVGALCDDDEEEEIERPDFWSSASHCKGEPANYDLLFDDTVVQRLDIIVSEENHLAAMSDLSSLLSSQGHGPMDTLEEDPIWFPVTIGYNGALWTQVGMRYKGNSSLTSAWQAGVRKLSFRLNFDKYEDEFPETTNQRFYGFKKMTFSNGFNDSSLIRDKLAADLFRAGGVPAARGAFVRVYLDYGEGQIYLGLYTMIEDPADEMLSEQFDDDNGNLYKPEDDCADWTCFGEASFEKKTNEDEENWSDIIASIEALHASQDDPEAWRSALEARFDVDLFLRWLAINQAMMNWDTYGAMTHNYYVYADPSDEGRLKWFPWDLNESMLEKNTPGDSNASVYLDQTSTSWPLIRFLLDDPVYRAQYTQALEEALAGPLEMEAFSAKAQAYHDLIAPYVVGDQGEYSPYTFLSSERAFEDSVDGSGGLIEHMDDRHAAVNQAIDSN